MAFSESLCLLLFLSSIFLVAFSLNEDNERKIYIVYMGEKPTVDYVTESVHRSILDGILENSSVEESLIYSYGRSFNGFAAKLTHKEQQKIAGMEGVVSVFPSKTLKLHTTRSWDFLGLSRAAKRSLAVERDVVIGLLDSGIWPESESFSGEGFGPPPSRWKGLCQNFTCNNKIVGARYYKNGYISGELSPRDFTGHGTHTSSTAAGNQVANASLFGLGLGTARGAVPAARIAMYKVCWSDEGCKDSDILAAFDDAIADGVDVLSVSLGASSPSDYFQDSVAIGSFHAVKKGILTAAAAGNSGPQPGTVSNVAPWFVSVGATSIDRRFVTRVVLGNNKTILGTSINTFDSPKNFASLVYMAGCDIPTDFDRIVYKDKIVLCDDLGLEPYTAGVKGFVTYDASGDPDSAFSFSLPEATLSYPRALELSHYIHDSPEPKAKIMKSDGIFDPEAPAVVSFSSRGPNRLNHGILKPDIVAPGVNILAAWPIDVPFRDDDVDTQGAPFNIISGTSMATPHVAGAAAYVKSFHPSWSAGAIMSALITTATPMKQTTHQDAELAYGAGELNPIRARSPGLVYESDIADYVKLLCTKYTTDQVRLVTGENTTTCPKGSKWNVAELNYPTMSVPASGGVKFRTEFPRTVTNVGQPKSTYRPIIKTGKLNVDVRPRVLSFDKLGEKKSFVVTVSGVGPSRNVSLSAAIMWSDGRHHVRSPINVYLDW